jgi:two-component sensor histidine kinase
VPDVTDDPAAREHKERRRLARLINALPVFSGFLTPDGHVNQSRPQTDEAFVWDLPLFAYSEPSISQIIDLCDQAAQGERVQIERRYLKNHPDESETFGRGLLTLSPVFRERNEIEEIAITLIDCDDAGVIPRDEYAKSRLNEANSRINAMLSLAQIVVEVSQSIESPSLKPIDSRRDALASRLDTLAAATNIMSDLDRKDYSLDAIISLVMETIPKALKNQRLQRPHESGKIPIHLVPMMILLLSELISNARQHGAWRENTPNREGSVSIQTDILYTIQGRVMRLHWIEDGGAITEVSSYTGFGLTLGERLFSEITGGTATLTQSNEGVSWVFDLPLTKANKNFDASKDMA